MIVKNPTWIRELDEARRRTDGLINAPVARDIVDAVEDNAESHRGKR